MQVMVDENASKKELLRIIDKQEKIIDGFQGISWFYRLVKQLPFLGRFFMFLAGILKSGTVSSLKIINNVKSENPAVLGICSPHPLNRGVKSATYSLTPDVMEVSEMFSRKSAAKVARKIAEIRPEKVVISGYFLGYDLLAEELKKTAPQIRIFAFIHSAFTWFGFDIYKTENPVFENMIKLAQKGVIEKIGFCKRDLAEYFGQKGIKTFFVMNRFEISKEEFRKISQDKIKIGVFGHSWWHRNILNQVVGALMVPNAEIHVNEIVDQNFLEQDRIIVHGFLPKKEFKKVLSEMDINLYVSFTDCFPMTLIESMEYGVPAIASDTSDVYSFDEVLKKDLTVAAIDSPVAISEKIKEVIENHEEIQKRIKKYLPVLKDRVEKSIEDFLK